MGSIACEVFFRSAGSGPSVREWQHVPVAETESVYATRDDVVFVAWGTLTEYHTMDGFHSRNAFPHKSGN